MKPLYNESLLDGILFENPDEIAVLAESVGRFAAHNAELCSFVNVWSKRLANTQPMTHPQLAGPGTNSYDLVVPAIYSEDVVSSIISACIHGNSDTDLTPVNTTLAGAMIEKYWAHSISSN